MNDEDIQFWFENNSTNPFLLRDITEEETMASGIPMPVSELLDGTTQIYITYKDNEYMDYYTSYSDAVSSYGKKTIYYNIDKGVEYATHLEMVDMSTSFSTDFKTKATTEHSSLLKKPLSASLAGAAAIYTSGMDQLSLTMNMMSDDVCGLIGDIGEFTFYSDTLRMINILMCLASKVGKISKIMTDNCAAQSIFGKLNALKSSNPTAALAMFDKMRGVSVTDFAGAEALCKLIFQIIDNFAGDMKAFLLNIMSLPGDLADMYKKFSLKMINDISGEILDCIEKANGMFTIGMLLDALIERDVNKLLQFELGGATDADKYLPAGVTLSSLAKSGDLSLATSVVSAATAAMIADSASAPVVVPNATNTATAMTNVLNTMNSSTTVSTSVTGGAEYLIDLAKKLKDK